MGFLDNSGDIILDAVLTDTGRKRLARGDGSFSVAKFALGDDEINYQLYDKTNSNGSAYYDISILQTPVLEAFTNNTSTMKSKLITISRTNILYLPILLLNENGINTTQHFNSTPSTRNGTGASATFVVVVDQDSANKNSGVAGVVNGYDPTGGTVIGFDQGINNTESPNTIKIDPDLEETQYVVQLDTRLGKLADKDGNVASMSFVDDDMIATYYLTMGSGQNSNFVFPMDPANPTDSTAIPSPLLGKRGSRLLFKIKASEDLQHSTHYFDKFGVDNLSFTQADSSSGTYYKIDSKIRIMGATTGYSVELPLRFIKFKS